MAGKRMERRRQFRTNFARVHRGFPESSSRLIMGDFAKWSGPSTTLASRGVLCNTPPPFRGENFLSGSDYGRDGLFRAQTRLGSGDVFTSRQEGFAMQLSGLSTDSRSGLEMGESTARSASHVGLSHLSSFSFAT